nr:hypothetical protein [Bacillus stercoris]
MKHRALQSVLSHLYFRLFFMALATVVSLLLKEHSKGKDIIEFIGTPGTAMLISLLLPLYGVCP